MLDDGTRSYPTDAGPSSYYGAGSYDYVSGLVGRFHNVVHAADQLLWSGCTQSQLGAIVELANIKVDSHISKKIYDRISQWADRILPLDYYNMKKLVRDLGLPVEKLDVYKNGYMLYWKDDIYLDHCKFCGEVRYKLTKEQTPNCKMIPHAILRHLSIVPLLHRLYALKAIGKHMTWHANHQMEEGSMCHLSDAEA
ncbi:UNVERIFIED_CONTAM: hypothetical protein Sindi_1383800 [Sesamum indicum]